MIARYFLNGLEKGESHVFFTSDEEPEAVKARLSAEGIEVDLCEQKNSLRILPIERFV